MNVTDDRGQTDGDRP